MAEDMSTAAMTPERFAELAEAYGPEIAAWPERLQPAARAHVSAGPEAADTLRRSAMLDAALADLAPVQIADQARPSDDLLTRVLGDAAMVAAQTQKIGAQAASAPTRGFWAEVFGDLGFGGGAALSGVLAAAALAGVLLGSLDALEGARPSFVGESYQTASEEFAPLFNEAELRFDALM